MGSITISGMLVLAALSTGNPELEMSRKPDYQQYAQASCSLTNQQRTGARKICYYTCGKTVRTLVVPAIKTCPFTIRN
ncbi:hypothetical protein [Parvibaculum sp.]|uniref:hypothetical protein n=1 Tax=Parvibaculum sp. TaxID=2024848 RepID=UPI0032993FF8